MRPSPVLAEIKKIFPGIKISQAPLPPEQFRETSIFFAPVKLSTKACKIINTSATRLENFARCPFAYYMNYILGAKPRKMYEVLPTDLGGLFHSVIAEFTKTTLGGRGGIAPSREEITAIVDDLVYSMGLEDSIFFSTARNKHILNKVRRVAAASCWALSEQIKRGEYRPWQAEYEIFSNISLDNGINLALKGFIDRVDIFQTDESEFVKIIDYKSGSAKFSKDEALKGVQLQLMLYLNAVIAQKKSEIEKIPISLRDLPNILPGGVFYFPIDDPIINADDIISEKERDEELLKCFKMSGLEVGDSKQSVSMDEFSDFGHEIDKKVKELGARLAEGDIKAEAYTKGQKCPCNYCKFSGICGNTS